MTLAMDTGCKYASGGGCKQARRDWRSRSEVHGCVRRIIPDARTHLRREVCRVHVAAFARCFSSI